jgi:hypothetical protein
MGRSNQLAAQALEHLCCFSLVLAVLIEGSGNEVLWLPEKSLEFGNRPTCALILFSQRCLHEKYSIKRSRQLLVKPFGAKVPSEVSNRSWKHSDAVKSEPLTDKRLQTALEQSMAREGRISFPESKSWRHLGRPCSSTHLAPFARYR